MNQKEYELIATTLRVHGEKKLAITFAGVLGNTYKNFHAHKFLGLAQYGTDEEGYPLCPYYGAKVLPDEQDQCSLCSRHEAW